MDQIDVQDILSLLQKSEVLGEYVLRDHSELVHMDLIRQKNREALSAMKHRNDNENIYLCMGNMFIKHRINKARSFIQDDQKKINDNIDELHKKIKDNVEKIQSMEGKSEQFSSFNLKPLSSEEMKGFNVILDSIKKLNL